MRIQIITIHTLLLISLAGCVTSNAATNVNPNMQPSATAPPASEPTLPPVPTMTPTEMPTEPPTPQAPATPTPAPTSTATPQPTRRPAPPTRIPPRVVPPPQTPPVSGNASEVPTRIVDAVKADLSRRSGVAPENMVIVSAESVEWGDSSLGCPQPGMGYMQVITSGYRMMIQAGNAIYDYRSDERGNILLCPA